MKLLFFGSPEFAVTSLRSLVDAGHRVVAVVTRPDRPRGRGRSPSSTAVKEAAEELGLEVLQPAGANNPDCIAELSALNAELGVVVAYGEILSPALLGATERGFLNVHASLLPDYRGAAPINWAVMRGEDVTGVTIIRMSPELDAGPILARREVPIRPEETAGELHDRLAAVGAELLTDTVNRLSAGEQIPGRPQPEEGGFFARKLTKEDGRINWNMPAEQIANRVRGLTPWPGAFCELPTQGGATRVTLLEVEALEPESPTRRPGTVVRAVDSDGILVQAGRGKVRIRKLKPAGGRAMSAADFLHGHQVKTASD